MTVLTRDDLEAGARLDRTREPVPASLRGILTRRLPIRLKSGRFVDGRFKADRAWTKARILQDLRVKDRRPAPARTSARSGYTTALPFDGFDDYVGFIDLIRRRRDWAETEARLDLECEQRIEASTNPHTIIPPKRGADRWPASPVYVRASFPRQLPGSRTDVGHPRWAVTPQEIDFMFLHDEVPPQEPEGRVRRLESKVPARSPNMLDEEAAFDAWVAGLDPEHSSEPFVDVLDPSRGDEPGDKFLIERNLTRLGRPESDKRRGQGHRPVCEAARRAHIHCADLSAPLIAVIAPYKPRPGKRDELMDIRRAVAICLRLEGFTRGTIAAVLRRDESRIEELIRGVKPHYPVRDEEDRPVKSNWSREGEGARKAVMRWHKERKKIAKEIETFQYNRPIALPNTAANRDRRDLPGAK